VGAGALPGLVRLLRAHKPTTVTRVVPGSGGVARRAADAITNLAHENVEIKVRAPRPGGGRGCDTPGPRCAPCSVVCPQAARVAGLHALRSVHAMLGP
jgi:hypothetical protein